MSILKNFFIVLGVIFFILILGAIYIWLADPFEIKPLLSSGITVDSVVNTISGNKVEVDNIDKNPLLNEDQEATLETLGVDPATLPTEITPAMQACFVDKLGEARTNEIIQGSSPTPSDFFQARSCLD